MLALGKKKFHFNTTPRIQSSAIKINICSGGMLGRVKKNNFYGTLLRKPQYGYWLVTLRESILNLCLDFCLEHTEWLNANDFCGPEKPSIKPFIHRFQESFWASKDNPGGDHKAFDMENEQLIRERKHYSQTPLSSKPYFTGFLLLV